MRHLAFAALAALCAARAALGIGASQEWVRRYVAGLTASTNGTFSADAGDLGTITARYEAASVAALVATNAAPGCVVTNGQVFAWAGGGAYRGGGETVTATQTNLVWRGLQSDVVDGIDTFAGAFGVVGTMVTPTQAEEAWR